MKYGVTQYRNYDNHFLFSKNTTGLDTSLTGLQKYDTGYLHNLGVLGSVSFPLYYVSERNAGFRLGFDQWNAYAFTEATERYYETQNPYADISYAQGAKAMQWFKLRYAQNIRPNWNFSVRYQRQQVNQPDYDNQATSLRSTGVNTWYNSPNGRYRVIAAINNNNFIQKENGGISNDSTFRDPKRVVRTGLEPNLSSARQQWSEQDHQITNILNLGPRIRFEKDSTDSTGKAHTYFKPGFYIAHKFRFRQQRYIYTDGYEPGKYFTAPAIDTNYSADRYLLRKFSNDIIISIPNLNRADSGKKEAVISGYAYARVENMELLENDKTLHYNNFSVGANIEGRVGNMDAQYYLIGYNAGDYKFHLRPTVNLDSNLGFTLTGLSQRYTPAYTDMHFNTNRLTYNVSLQPVFVNEVSAEVNLLKNRFGARVTLNNTANYIYYVNNQSPTQLGNNLQYARVNAYAKVKVGIFRFNHELILQRSTNMDKLSLPQIVGRISYFVEGVPYGVLAQTPNAIIGQIGFDLTYISKFDGLSYFPLQAKFTVDNPGYAGSYPYIDLWATARIKKFFLFLKLEHANAGLTGTNYLLLQGYPLHPRVFRLGLRWVFLN